MKKLLGMILTLALAAGLAWPVYAESSTVPPEVTAHAYLVMDAQTGRCSYRRAAPSGIIQPVSRRL